MKKSLLIVLSLFLVIAGLAATQMQPSKQAKALDIQVQGSAPKAFRNAPEFTFTKLPTALMTSYYDYMIGSYNGLPLRVTTDPDFPGYFMTYHGKRTASGTRRVYYAHLDANGNVLNNNEITAVDNNEGYPTLAVDPVSGKPMYAWHASNAPNDELVVEFTSDAYMFGISGLFNELDIIADNPSTIILPNGVEVLGNEFIWPTAVVGPSPVTGKRRVYVSMRNNTSHALNGNPSENPLIAYADFDGDMLEGGVPLDWQHTTVPFMDAWNNDLEALRRPSNAIYVDNLGNLFYLGYHNAWDADENSIHEPQLDVFKCDNYGEGTWVEYHGSDDIETWNPEIYEGSNDDPLFGDPDEYPDIVWSIINSGHLNAVSDARGRGHFGALYSVYHPSGVYWPAFHTVKSVVWNPNDNSFSEREIYPQKPEEDDFNQVFTHWDVEAPFGEEDYDDGILQLSGLTYPFPHWDQSLHSDAMFFHYSNVKLSEANEKGMMVAVWQDSYRAKRYNADNDDDYLAYAQTPEIWISVSPDNGDSWSEPIILNNVDTPEFAGIKPMWVYPADKVLFIGEENGHNVGKIGFMFYDDFTWGSYSNSPPAHQNNDGGDIMFMELQITFPIPGANQNNTVPAVSRMLNPNYPNPFNPETNISFDMPKAGAAKLEIYNVKGQLVKSLFDGTAQYGRNSLVWNGMDNRGNKVPSGIYFYRLSTEGKSETRKMMLMK
ncbi:MAG: T9SS type A sorting domain-containing protein [Candidatus Cloacimonetes bacterium]|nr:T9SS type A sorting domain-containing protein [Candidatus Cloacimonadota bacterium]